VRAELIAGVFVLALATPLQAQTKLAPVDEAARNPAFLAFRASLREAIARRDEGAVLAVVDSSIKNGFGGDDGIAAFEKQWEPRSPSSRLWAELGSTLALGGTFDGEGNFVAPYVYSRWPEAIDAFGHVAITGSGVRVREKPSLEGAIVGRLSYAIMPRGRKAAASGAWNAVRRSNGSTGYVASQYVRSPVGYRAFFAPVAGGWKLMTFVAGD
jgi:hypothetical protein